VSAVGKKMKPLDDEIAKIDAEIARLGAVKDGLLRAKTVLTGAVAPAVSGTRKRSPNIKPMILDIMKSAGTGGATSNDVSATVRDRVPTVAKDTVGSILSRLKADRALVFDGERYYDTRFAPKIGGTPAFALRLARVNAALADVHNAKN
jgi:hypothetical protein